MPKGRRDIPPAATADHAAAGPRPRAGVLLAAVLSLAAPAPAAEKPLWLLVTRPSLAEAVKPLADHRAKEGFATVVSTAPVAKALRTAKRPPAFLLLVGDDQPGQENQPWHLPAKRRNLYRWRAEQTRQFASDALWGDLDGDLIPDFPVGRLPARTAQQARQMAEKIIAYERRAARLEDLHLPVWAGSPCFGEAFDRIATGMMVANVRQLAPAWGRLWFMTADPRHPLCGWPTEQPAVFTRRLQAGGLMAVFMCHADAEKAFALRFDGRNVVYDIDGARAMAKGDPAPPLLFLSCYSGNFTRRRPCLAESLLMLPAGPVATLGATAESHPLTNFFSGICLLKALRANHRRVGTLWHAAQAAALRERHFLAERLLRNVEGKLEDQINVGKLRRDQILMYALLGDPATRLRMPRRLDVKVAPTAAGWAWRAVKPKQAKQLHVGLRAVGPALAPVAGARTPAEARERFVKANAAFAFSPVATLKADAPWRGVIAKPGRVRFVASGADGLYVAAATLKPPARAPATLPAEVARRIAALDSAATDAQAVEVLIGALTAADPRVRAFAARALGRIGDARARPALTAALKDGDAGVRKAAAEALKRIQDKKPRTVQPAAQNARPIRRTPSQ